MTFSATPLRRRSVRATAFAAVAGASVLLSGCFAVTDQSTYQADTTGTLSIGTNLCVGTQSDLSAPPASGTTDNCTAMRVPPRYQMQLYVAYQLPDGIPAPTKVNGYDAVDANLGPSAEYAQQVQGLDPADAGSRWVGYASDPFDLPSVNTSTAGSVEAPLDASSVPIGQSLVTRTVTGFRWVRPAATEQSAWLASRPIVCSAAGAPYGPSKIEAEGTSCIYGRSDGGKLSGAETAGSSTTTSPNEYAFNQLAIDKPTTAPSVLPGETATVAVPVRSRLATEFEPKSVGIKATTTLSGATVTSPETFALGGAGSLAVKVAVPSSATPGTYSVTVNGSAKSGLRTQTFDLVVKGAAPVPTVAPSAATPAPVASAGAGPAATAAPTSSGPVTEPQLASSIASTLSSAAGRPGSLEALRDGDLTIPFASDRAGIVRATLFGQGRKGRKGAILAVGTARFDGKTAGSIELHLTDEGEDLVRGRKQVKGSLVLRFWGKDGKTVTAPVPFTLK